MSAQNKNFFIKIDEFIFHKIDLFKADGSFQKINEFIATLDEDKQKIFAQTLTFSLAIIPFIITLFLWWGNHKTKNSLEIKNQILEQISSLKSNKDSLLGISSNLLSPNPIRDQNDLDNRIRNIMSSSNIDQSKVRIENFNQVYSNTNFVQIEASLQFKNFGTQDFSSFMRSVVDGEKFRVVKINLIKDTNTNLLQGQMSLIHLGKNSGF